MVIRHPSTRLRTGLIFAILLLCVATAWGQQVVSEPHVGYLYPAGGQQGSVVQITVGGQFLRGAVEVHISGQGVRGSVIKYMPPLRNINADQRKLLLARLKELRDKRLAELSEKEKTEDRGQTTNVSSAFGVQRSAFHDATRGTPYGAPVQDGESAIEYRKRVPSEVGGSQIPNQSLPEHPLLYDLENKSLRELAHITSLLFFPREKLQMNRQISEFVLIEVIIDPNAEPGDHELRLRTATGLTNPIVFHVGLLPEVRELEPNAGLKARNLERGTGFQPVKDMARMAMPPSRFELAAAPEPHNLPVVLNGQIMPGDVDRFRIRAGRGQKLVMEVHARSLIPYLADAVPGWFQATLALYDAQGKEVAFADDYRFNPDPVLYYEIPEDGEYELEIRDSLYRGREDFVYRIAVSERPFITQMFPLGGREGVETVASISGWNLPTTRLPLDTRPATRKAGEPCGDGLRRTACREGKQFSNSVPYAVDTSPECDEVESNDGIPGAQKIELPKIINGRIDRPGDVDLFRFQGRAGDKVVAEVCARRLNSPLDSLLRLTDATGHALEWNDDYVIEDNHLYENTSGLLTHHADSYLMAELPKDAEYFVQLTDSQNHGGPAYSYRLRVTVAQGDFALRVTPSSLSTRAGGTIAIGVHVLRKDGFDGEIDMVLKDAPAGFKLDGARIPAGRDRVRITLTAPVSAPGEPVALQLEGRALIRGQTIRRPAVPADDVMQAFLYRHLVPAQEMLVFVQKARWGVPAVELASGAPVRIPAGGSAQVHFRAGKRAGFNDVQFQLSQPPEGLSLGETTIAPNGLTFQVKADKDLVKAGFADNLIIEAFRETFVRAKDGTPTNQKRRASIVFLPAVPIQIVPQ